MAAYIVRTIDDHDIVGFFVADEMDDLLIAVDECTEPADCEYIELPAGGIFWPSPAIAVPLKPGDPEDDDSEAEELPWEGAHFSEPWWSVVYGHSDDKWTEFFPDKPRKPRPKPPPGPMGPGQVVPLKRRRS
jgi:hypothetical protein